MYSIAVWSKGWKLTAANYLKVLLNIEADRTLSHNCVTEKQTVLSVCFLYISEKLFMRTDKLDEENKRKIFEPDKYVFFY